MFKLWYKKINTEKYKGHRWAILYSNYGCVALVQNKKFFKAFFSIIKKYFSMKFRKKCLEIIQASKEKTGI